MKKSSSTIHKTMPANSRELTDVNWLTNEVARLTAENAILNNIIHSLPGNVYWKDKNGRFLGSNKNTLAVTPCKTLDQLIGSTLHDLFNKEFADPAAEIEKQIIEEEIAISCEELGVDNEGNPAIYLSKKMPLYDLNNRVAGTIGISFNINDRKKMEEELKIAKEKAEIASHAKSEFIANMSHDVKTPLAGMIGVSELLAYRLNNEDKELAETLLMSGRQLLAFIENCLELSRMENGSVFLESDRFLLTGLLDEIYELFQPTLRTKQLQMIINIDDKIPKYLIGNRSGLYRILMNLVGNGVKFTSNGCIDINIVLGSMPNERNAVIKFHVKDTGIGIAKENQEMIFERFTRIVPSYKGTHDGSGIGLYIVQTFVAKMGGEIYLQSAIGQGSQFTIILPFQVPLLSDEDNIELVSGRSQATPCKTEASSYPLARILLVEDNPVARRIESSLLHSLQCQLDLADNAEQALELFAPDKYDLILIDIGLPNMQGNEAAAIMRKKELNTGCKPATIIALTAHTNETMNEEYRNNGINRTLSKPLLRRQAEELLDQVTQSN